MKVNFQLLDCDYILVGDEPIIRLFGRSEDDKSVCAFIKGYKPYIYVEPTKEFEPIIDFLKKNFNNQVLTVRIVERFLPIGYQPNKTKLLKIFLKNPAKTPTIRSELLKQKFVKNVYEADILFKNRFMADYNLHGMKWIHASGIPTSTNTVRTDKKIEVEDIKEIDDKTTTLKYLSIDIETVSSSEKPPDSEKDPIIMISLSFLPRFQNRKSLVLVAKPIHPYPNTKCFKNEKEMLEEFVRIIHSYDPDIITGYNINNFDIPYIVRRLVKNRVSRVIGRCKQKSISSRKIGTMYRNTITGRIIVDVYELVKESVGKGLLRLKRYGLGDVSKELLGEGKIDITHSEITKFWNGDEEKIKRLIDYNRKDSELALRLLVEKGMLDKFIELSKVCGLVLQDVLDSGESARVENLLLREFNKAGFVMPIKPTEKEILKRKEERVAKALKGALVLEPKVGLHTKYTIYLDFKAMYPSIFISFNICPTTLCIGKVKEKTIKTPYGTQFVVPEVRVGIVPKTIRKLISERDRIKTKMKKSTNASEKALLNAKQLALKYMTNAFYGYTGYVRARTYTLDIANAITSCGRYFIQKTKKIVEEDKRFTVLYGDSLDYNRRIILQDPQKLVKVVKIGEFVDSFLKEDKSQEKFISGWKALCLENGKPEFKPIIKVVRHRYNPEIKGNLLKITTKWGETIVTPQHSIYTCNDGKIRLEDARNLNKNSFLVFINKIPNIETIKELDVLKFLPSNCGLYLYIPKNLVSGRLEEECHKKNIRRRKDCFVIPLSKLEQLSEKLRKADVLKKCFIGGWGAYSKKNIAIPAVIPLNYDFGYLVGMYVAEGSAINKNYYHGRKVGVSIVNKDLKIIRKLVKIIKKIFKKEVRPFVCDKRSNTYRISLNGIAFYTLFEKVLGAGTKAKNKRIPSIILSAPESVKQGFYHGYYEGDGNPRYKSTPRFDTVSEGLRDDLCVLLKMLGRRKLVSFNYRDCKHVWRLNYVNFSRSDVKKINESVGGIKIKYISRVKPTSKFVYDIEVAGAHNFVDAHGCMLVHNTDSVFVATDAKTPEEAFEIGEMLEKKINEGLEGKIQMKIESVFKTLLILSKKRYAGLSMEKTNNEWHEKIVMKGIETVRRDWCNLTGETLLEVVKIILKEQNPKKALTYVRDVINKLAKNQVPIEELVITKGISKPLKSYKGMQPHIELVKKLRKRSPAEAPGIGDRIGFVIISGPQLVSRRAEDPKYVKKHNLKIDSKYYIESQILPPLERVFTAIGFSRSELKGFGRQLSLSDLKNNFHKPQKTILKKVEGFICSKCGETYRRPPLVGKCEKCGSELLFYSGEEKSKYFNLS